MIMGEGRLARLLMGGDRVLLELFRTEDGSRRA